MLVPGILEHEVKAALDAGAEGIVYPLVRSVADAERAVAYATYPPAGTRGWGPFAAHARHGVALGDYLSGVGPQITCCLLIETAEAVENIEAILAVPGIDLIVLAQFDLSTALGVHGRFDAAPFLEAVASVERAAHAASIPLGTSALTPEQSRAAVTSGYRVLIHGFDVLMLKQQVAAFRDWA
ncbi:MAG: 4-hydroxy-2-oxoheptanedioate aldolase [Thermoleophilaceae bacterium]|nr:4-hydroxy-2-oxoheptanedioate aldolase [Thermoleophilaceae bacterium]